jgi:hypothetical protein
MQKVEFYNGDHEIPPAIRGFAPKHDRLFKAPGGGDSPRAPSFPPDGAAAAKGRQGRKNARAWSFLDAQYAQ